MIMQVDDLRITDDLRISVFDVSRYRSSGDNKTQITVWFGNKCRIPVFVYLSKKEYIKHGKDFKEKDKEEGDD